MEWTETCTKCEGSIPGYAGPGRFPFCLGCAAELLHTTVHAHSNAGVVELTLAQVALITRTTLPDHLLWMFVKKLDLTEVGRQVRRVLDAPPLLA